jgi:hypothetical protein
MKPAFCLLVLASISLPSLRCTEIDRTLPNIDRSQNVHSTSHSHHKMHHNNCPVSVSMNQNLSSDLYYSYPIEKYGLSSQGDVKLSLCKIHDILAKNHTALGQYNCSIDPSFCPINSQNFVDSSLRSRFKFMSKNSSSPFCILNQKLNNPNRVSNVIYFGGSITSGAYTEGCSANYSQKCRNSRYCESCSWTERFGEWMKRSFKAKVVSQKSRRLWSK